MSESAGALALARELLADRRCWVVGGAVRDELRGLPPSADLDLVIDGAVEPAARALARAARGTAFSLSDAFGGWRVVAPGQAWQADLNPLRGDTIEADLRLRDFTVNAIARPLEGGAVVDPLGGAVDLADGRLRLAAPDAIDADPLRALRLVRMACELGLRPDAAACDAARAAAPALAAVAAERVYAELRRVLASARPADGMRLAIELGSCAVVLPEVAALAGVEQSRFHHLDALAHTLEVLERLVELEHQPEAVFGPAHGEALRAMLREPLGDGMTHAQVLRFGALLHDVAKPLTRSVAPDGRIVFPRHDERGAELARSILTRLRAAERVRARVAALTLTHLRLGFLVHEAPLSRRALYGYLAAANTVAADVTLLSVADRLATRGAGSDDAIARHLELAREVIGAALRWQRDGRPPPLVRGDELARALDLAPGPLIGELLVAIEEEAFAGALHNAADAIAFAADRIP